MDASTEFHRASITMQQDQPFTTGNTLADRIMELLGQGLSGSVVAAAVGVTPSYVSQLLENEDFRLEVSIRRAGKAEAGLARDNSWDGVEKLAIGKMFEIMEKGLISRPNDLIRIAQIANSAKRTAKELESADGAGAPTVVISVPEAAIVHFKMNSESQVIEIDARSTEALPTSQLQKQLAARRASRISSDVTAIANGGKKVLPAAQIAEKRKVASTLEAIGFSEEAEPVANVLALGRRA
jgi:transcriptional regulator with XRE-family HTH domain